MKYKNKSIVKESKLGVLDKLVIVFSIMGIITGVVLFKAVNLTGIDKTLVAISIFVLVWLFCYKILFCSKNTSFFLKAFNTTTVTVVSSVVFILSAWIFLLMFPLVVFLISVFIKSHSNEEVSSVNDNNYLLNGQYDHTSFLVNRENSFYGPLGYVYEVADPIYGLYNTASTIDPDEL